MVTIKCINPNCTAPERKFTWDETPHGGLATPREEGAKRVIAYCPFCGAENPVWVKKPQPTTILRRGAE